VVWQERLRKSRATYADLVALTVMDRLRWKVGNAGMDGTELFSHMLGFSRWQIVGLLDFDNASSTWCLRHPPSKLSWDFGECQTTHRFLV